MIELRVPKEIRAYKEKLIFGMTIRQFTATFIAFSINVPLYIYGKNFLGDEIMSWIVIFISVPIFAIGYFEYNSMPLEQFFVAVLQSEFIYPKKRVYKTENIYENMMNLHIKEEFLINRKGKFNVFTKYF